MYISYLFIGGIVVIVNNNNNNKTEESCLLDLLERPFSYIDLEHLHRAKEKFGSTIVHCSLQNCTIITVAAATKNAFRDFF